MAFSSTLRTAAVAAAGLLTFICATGCASASGTPAHASPHDFRDLYSDTWVGTDALGREMPTHEEVGPPRTDKERVVSIFYMTWHGGSFIAGDGDHEADVTRILEADPDARLDGNHPGWKAPGTYYHWGEPEMGYFISTDEWVIRRDMAELVDAGVDVLVMDVTNGVRYWDEWDVTFSVMEKMRAEGNKTPTFCFWAFNGPSIRVVHELYERIYAQEKYKDLWFYWDGKPLMLYNSRPEVDATPVPRDQQPHLFFTPEAVNDPDHPRHGDPKYTTEFYEDYPQEVKDFFTLRMMWWGYWNWRGERFIGVEGNWCFGYDLTNPNVAAMDPMDLVAPWQGEPEQAAVTAAQHPMSYVGKSWSRANGQPDLDVTDMPIEAYVPWLDEVVDDPVAHGIYFQERWDEAIAADPRMIYVNDWNEWIAGKFDAPEGVTWPFLGRTSNFRFIDQYNAEFNRGIQPMKDGYTDNYYMQMAQNIRRYKGARPIPTMQGHTPIAIDGAFDDWRAIDVEYRDTIGDTAHRDHRGYAGLHYSNTSGRNDIITAKVAVGETDVAFYAETAGDLTPVTDPNWMLLLIDADRDSSTGWYGYDYLVNKRIMDRNSTVLMKYEGGNWREVAAVPYSTAGAELEIAIPRDLIGLGGDEVSFDFKWADNPQDLENPISLVTHGDTAPNRRFNYRVIWER